MNKQQFIIGIMGIFLGIGMLIYTPNNFIKELGFISSLLELTLLLFGISLIPISFWIVILSLQIRINNDIYT